MTDPIIIRKRKRKTLDLGPDAEHEAEMPADAAFKKRIKRAKVWPYRQLNDVVVEDVLETKGDRRNRIVHLYDTATVAEAMRTMANNDIIAVPIVTAGDGGRYSASITVLDLVSGIVTALGRVPGMEKVVNWERMDEIGETFMKKPVTSVAGLAGETSVLLKCEPGTFVMRVIKEGFLGEGRDEPVKVHRVYFEDSRGYISGILSQSDVIRYLADNLDVLHRTAEVTLQSLGLIDDKVATVRVTDAAVSAFELMAEKKVSGVAVVNDEGALVSTIAASDLRGMHPKDFHLLGLSVEEFLQRRRGPECDEASGKLPPPYTCEPDTPFGEAVRLLAALAVHRLYVTGPNDVPVGVLTLSDAIQVVAGTTQHALTMDENLKRVKDGEMEVEVHAVGA